MNIIIELIIEIVLAYPGALVYKICTNSNRPIKEIVLEGPYYLYLIGLVTTVLLIFGTYSLYEHFAK